MSRNYLMKITKINTGRFWRFFFFLILFLVFSSCTIYRFPEFEGKKIQQFEMVELGGIKQGVLIRGDDKDNPVMLFLHGGPGYPLFPFAPMGETMNRMEKAFTMVYWEQRGTGKSLSRRLPPETMNVDQFVSDLKELVAYVQKTMGVEKVFIWAHSWGTNFGAIFAAQYPEMVHAYVSTGQSVNPYRNERLAYEFVMDQAKAENNRRALREMATIDTLEANYRLEDALLVRKWVYRYGGIVKRGAEERFYVNFNDIFLILAAPQYSVLERLNLILYPYFSAQRLWPDLKAINLIKQASRIEVPVFFLVGKHDIIVSAKLAEEYFEALDAPAGKELIWFERSAHRPHKEEREKFLEVMKTHILESVLPRKDDPEKKEARTRLTSE